MLQKSPKMHVKKKILKNAWNMWIFFYMCFKTQEKMVNMMLG